MRAAGWVVLGLAIGAIGSAMAINALRQRTPLPDAVMTLMQYHMAGFKQSLKQGQCPATANQAALQSLDSLAATIDPAFAGADAGFVEHSRRLHQAIDQARAMAPTNCAQLGQAVLPIGQACQSCHEQYR